MLQGVLSDDSIRRRATRAGMRFAEEPDGAETAADAIERRFVAGSPMPLPLQPGQSESGDTG